MTTIGPDDLARIEARAAEAWKDNEPTHDVPALVAALRDAWAERDGWEQAAIDAANEVEARWNGLDRQALIRERDEALAALIREQRTSEALRLDATEARAALARVEALCDGPDFWDPTDFDAGRQHAYDAIRAAIKGESNE